MNNMIKEIRPGRMRMPLDIPTEIYKDVKRLALHENTAMVTVVTWALVEYINGKKDVLKPYRDAKK